MNTRSFITLWVIGIGAVVAWFWGDHLGIPKDAQIAASQLGGGLIGYAINAAKNNDTPTSSAPLTQPQPEQSP